MMRAMLCAAAAAAGLWSAPAVGANKAGCCAPGAACCEAGLPCCEFGTCCFDGSPCCFPGSPCCDGADCCAAAKACCGPKAACCAVPAGLVALLTAVRADAPADAKPVTLTGTLVCGKCGLNEPGKCSNVLQVKDGGKVVNYYLTDKGNGEAYHEDVCGGGKVEGVTVTGTVSEKDGKKWVAATKVAAPKK